MNPAFSVVVFTTLAGAAQGLVVALALAVLAAPADGADRSSRAASPSRSSCSVAGLAASFLHLGRPARAWRAAAMWRTSWLSREVIVLPAFIALVALWWLALRDGGAAPGRRAAAARRARARGAALVLHGDDLRLPALHRGVGAAADDRQLRPARAVVGMRSGERARRAGRRARAALAVAARRRCRVTLVAWATRIAALRRNAAIRHRSTLQTATGIRVGAAGADVDGHVGRIVQHARVLPSRVAAGAAAASSWRRDRASASRCRRVCCSRRSRSARCPALAASPRCVQAPGLLADRWFFFAQAKHPQNLYYQVVS